ncbi:MAG: phenylalanine--tRNA ligase subunit beta [Phycisphaeraceae bacterium]|nr:MAG: phenylalanine--tRNA ligase subunit beta [Phycisphaeraceae bacterium]
MNISLQWLNRYLSEPVTAPEAEEILTHVGFPLESSVEKGPGDWLMDVEVTSNRGDCLSHLGVAREIAAKTGRTLVMPSAPPPKRAGRVGDVLTLTNETPDACPRFTAQVVRNVKVGPSPAWIRDALEAVGQRSISNIVDVTNFITLELGNPCHVFDLDKLEGRALRVRYARKGEPLKTLDGKQRTLVETDLVVADTIRAQSLAGVIGGADSEVSASTVNVVLEMATWDPATIRRAARRLGIRTDAGYRFERGVHPATLDDAARRAAELIVQVAGGELAEGILSEGKPVPKPQIVELRPSRCAAIIGQAIPAGDIIAMLRRLDIDVSQRDEDTLACEIPAWRIDLEREIDLIEEVARIRGLDTIEVSERLPIAIRPPQPTERAARELTGVLTGMGFYEAVTFTFVTPAQAAPFAGPGVGLVKVDDERRGADGTLRPSVLPGLLLCRRSNRMAQVEQPGGVRLFEISATFGQDSKGDSLEARRLGMLLDAPLSGKRATHDDRQTAVRLARGAVEAVVLAMAGPRARVSIEPKETGIPAWESGASGTVWMETEKGRRAIGTLGLMSKQTLDLFELEHPVACAELEIEPLLAAYPGGSAIEPLPAFPSIERDLSLVVAENVPWARFEALLARIGKEREMALLESSRFVGVYRGEQAGKGKKSVTLRMRFRAADRTLRHEEVDPQVARVIAEAKSELNAELRA